jgi:hypothetical protein
MASSVVSAASPDDLLDESRRFGDLPSLAQDDRKVVFDLEGTVAVCVERLSRRSNEFPKHRDGLVQAALPTKDPSEVALGRKRMRVVAAEYSFSVVHQRSKCQLRLVVPTQSAKYRSARLASAKGVGMIRP